MRFVMPLDARVDFFSKLLILYFFILDNALRGIFFWPSRSRVAPEALEAVLLDSRPLIIYIPGSIKNERGVAGFRKVAIGPPANPHISLDRLPGVGRESLTKLFRQGDNMIGTRVNRDGSITFLFNHMSAGSVQVAGNFSNWQTLPMDRGQDGWWYLTTRAMSSGHYEYLFVADGQWTRDQFNMRTTPGGTNSYLGIGAGTGYLYRDSFFSRSLGKNKRFTIYLPPAYPFEENNAFPALYIMAGLLDDDFDWSRKGHIEDALDALISGGSIGDMVVVMPDKDEASEAPYYGSPFASYLAGDMVDHVEDNFKVFPDGSQRAIDGLSLGAAWSIRCGTAYPGHYAAVGAMSGGFGEDVVEIIERNAPAMRSFGTRFRLMVGDQEGDLIENNRMAKSFLEGKGLFCEMHVKHGIHDWPIWIEDIYGALQFHYHSFKR